MLKRADTHPRTLNGKHHGEWIINKRVQSSEAINAGKRKLSSRFIRGRLCGTKGKTSQVARFGAQLEILPALRFASSEVIPILNHAFLVYGKITPKRRGSKRVGGWIFFLPDTAGKAGPGGCGVGEGEIHSPIHYRDFHTREIWY